MPYADPAKARERFLSRVGHCCDCGKKCGEVRVLRCKTCSNKARTIVRGNCPDCGCQLRKRAKRCLACHNKAQDRGLSRERTKFNNSDAWRRARTDCFVRDGYTCQGCDVIGGRLNAHHFMQYVDAPELRLSLENLVTVCEPCHRYIHFGVIECEKSIAS